MSADSAHNEENEGKYYYILIYMRSTYYLKTFSIAETLSLNGRWIYELKFGKNVAERIVTNLKYDPSTCR
jgi:hypothetical protein